MSTTHPAPLLHGAMSTPRRMALLLLACTPGVLLSTWFRGYGLLLTILFCCVLAWVLEAVLGRLRGRDPRQALLDRSALVSAVILSIALPPGSPWWLLSLGLLFGIGIGKHAFGGLGQNPFNPAMTGYLFLLLVFPRELATWHLPYAGIPGAESPSPLDIDGLRQSLIALFPALANDSGGLDGMAMATPQVHAAALPAVYTQGLSVWGRAAGTAAELVNLGFLSGGLFLLALRIIDWRIPLGIVGMVCLGVVFTAQADGNGIYQTLYLQLVGSWLFFGAFFIATDSVSAAVTPLGRICYGVIIGALLLALRDAGQGPHAIAVAVVFGNFCAPLLDHLLRPPVYGRPRHWLTGPTGEANE